MEIIKDKLEDDVVPMMVGYAGLGVVLAIIELICVVLACAYVAQIRRSKPTNDNVFLSSWWKKTNQIHISYDVLSNLFTKDKTNISKFFNKDISNFPIISDPGEFIIGWIWCCFCASLGIQILQLVHSLKYPFHINEFEFSTLINNLQFLGNNFCQ